MDKIAVRIEEAVEMTGIGRASIYRAFKSGALTGRKAGSRTLILVDELRRYMESLPQTDLMTAGEE